MDSEEALNKLVSETIGMSEVVEHVRNLIEVVISKMDKMGGGKAAAAGPKVPAASASGGDVLAVVQSFASKLAVATASVLAFVAAPPLMAAAALQFVQALNPGIAEQFNRVLANLQATIGYGLEPIIDIAISTLKTWTATLMPAIDVIRPVMADLAQTIGEVLTASLMQMVLIVRVVVAVFSPLLRVITLVVRWLMQVADVVYTIVGAFFDWIDALLAGMGYFDMLNSLMKGLKDVLNGVVVGFGFLALMLFKLLHLTSAITGFRDALQKRLDERRNGGGLVAAPKDVSTGGIEDISRKITERAFQAQSGGGGSHTDNELLEQLVEMADTVAEFDLEGMIKRAVRAALQEARDAVGDKVENFYDKVKDVSSAPFRALRRIASPLTDEDRHG